MTVTTILLHPLTPLARSNVKYFNFLIIKSVVNIFTKLSLLPQLDKLSDAATNVGTSGNNSAYLNMYMYMVEI